MIGAGKRDQLITFEREVVDLDSYGGEIRSWGHHGTEYAAVFYGKGDERRAAAAESGKQAANFKVLANPMTLDIALTDRIVHGGSIYDIVGIAPQDRGSIEFTGVRAL